MTIPCVHRNGCPDWKRCVQAEVCLGLKQALACPFARPVTVNLDGHGAALIDANHELVCVMEAATREEVKFIVAAINAYEGDE